MNSQPDAIAAPTSVPRLLSITLSAAALTAVADYLFWKAEPGVTVGIFAALMALVIVALGGCSKLTRAALAALVLLPAACWQSAMDLSFTNTTVLLVLLIVLAGEVFHTALASGFQRWFAQLLAVVLFPGRLAWLATRWVEKRTAETAGGARSILRGFAVVLPALFVGLLFLALLAGGNSIMREIAGRGFDKFGAWLVTWDFSFGRCFSWAVTASIALAFIRPSQFASQLQLPAGDASIRAADPGMRRMQCIALLVVVNAVFGFANTVDAVFLWRQETVPANVPAKEFMHDGTNNLIAATVIAGVVLATVFQHLASVTNSRALRGLGLLWIAQNVALAASVLKRLHLYVADTGLLTDVRIYVACFVALVVAGYVFLTFHVIHGRRLGWLLRCNALATFVLFYTVQFFDVRGFAANGGATRALVVPGLAFPSQYWATQGWAAYPALIRIAESNADREAVQAARDALVGLREQEKSRLTREDWRSMQVRRDRAVNELLRWDER